MESPESSIVLVCGADDNYAKPLAVTLFSALSNLDPGWAVDLHLIDGGIRPRKKERLERVVQTAGAEVDLDWEHVDPQRLEGLPSPWEHITPSCYLRLFIPEILPETRAKAIYLDSDLVVEGSLSQLWNEPVDGAPALVVPSTKRVKDCVDNCRELGLRPEAPYFAGGVLVINLARWRDMNVSDQALTYLRSHEELPGAEQKALNVVLAEEWNALDPSWNVFFSVEQLKEAMDPAGEGESHPPMLKLLQDAEIRHYAGPLKPWRTDIGMEAYPPDRRRWLRYFWASGWPTRLGHLLSKVRYYTLPLREFVVETRNSLREWMAQKLPFLSGTLTR